MSAPRVLSDEQRVEIRRLAGSKCRCCGSTINQSTLAKKFGVTPATISNIVKRKKYYR